MLTLDVSYHIGITCSIGVRWCRAEAVSISARWCSNCAFRWRSFDGKCLCWYSSVLQPNSASKSILAGLKSAHLFDHRQCCGYYVISTAVNWHSLGMFQISQMSSTWNWVGLRQSWQFVMLGTSLMVVAALWWLWPLFEFRRIGTCCIRAIC